MIEIYCETGVVARPMVAANRRLEGSRIFAGDLRATFTYPFSVDIIEVYRETSPEYGTMSSFQPGDMHIQMIGGHANNHVLRFSIFLPESMQGFALAAFIRSDITGAANTVEEHALEFLRDN